MSPGTRVDKTIFEYGLVIITGGSSGIGNSIIERIKKVESGPAICNLSRTKPASFLNDSKETHLECDLADPIQRKSAFEAALRHAGSLSGDRPILLVNNAGFGLYNNVDARPIEEHLELIQVNLSALVELSLMMLPLIKERGGALMNIASTSAFQPTPHLATYGASKTFVLNWSLALNEELRPFPQARAIAICPGPTRTNFFKRAGFTKHVIPGGLSMSSETVVEQAFIALSKGLPYSIPGLRNRLVSQIASILPKSLVVRLASRIIGRYRTANLNQN